MYRGKTFTNNIDATTFNTIKLSIGEARLTVTRLTPVGLLGNAADVFPDIAARSRQDPRYLPDVVTDQLAWSDQ
jgi:urocanate hydratase